MNNTTTDRQRQRAKLTADILQQVRNAVQDELADAPESFGFEELESIEEIVLSDSQHIVEALSVQEMQSERALVAHIARARTSANRLIREGSSKR
jgi:hypothetical protein